MDLLREKLRARGHHRAQVAAAMIGSAVVGGVISSSASKSAANTQANAANNATQAQTGMFDKTVGLEAPFRQAGIDAQTKLSNLLGTGSGGGPLASGSGGGPLASGTGGVGPQTTAGGAFDPNTFNADAYLAANSDVAQYIAAHPPGSVGATTALEHYQKFGQNEGRLLAPAAPGTVESPTDIWRRLAGQYTDANGNVNSDALNPAVSAEAAREQQAAAAAQAGAAPSQPAGPSQPAPQNDFTTPGSLLKPFSLSDFQLDPGIQFQTQQGNLALQNSQAAKDGVMSGAALKDLIGYNQGMAGTGYQSAFDRYMANKSFTLGALTDTANRGQAAAGNTVNAAPSFSAGIAGTIQGAGNASAAGTIGSANALSGALTGSSNAFLLRNLLGGSGGSGGVTPPNPFLGGGGGVLGDGLSIDSSFA